MVFIVEASEMTFSPVLFMMMRMTNRYRGYSMYAHHDVCYHTLRRCRPPRDLGLLRPVGKRLVVLRRLPLLNKGQEVGLAGYVLPQLLGHGEAFRCLVVLEDAAECSFSCAYYPV
jgi:hypothetical protein